MTYHLPLRFFVPLIIMIFCVVVTIAGYLTVRAQTEQRIVSQAKHHINMELNKLQGLVEYALENNSISLLRQIHAGKLSESDLKALVITDAQGQIVASTTPQDLGRHWGQSSLVHYRKAIQNTLEQYTSHNWTDADKRLITGMINVCTRDFRLGLRGQSCGFILYQVDLKIRLDEAIGDLFRQTIYITLSIAVGMLLLIATLDLLISRRLVKIHEILRQWQQGERKQRIKPGGADEIAEIGNKIDQLLSRFSEDEQALIYNQQLTQAVIESANYSMITADTKGMIQTLNPMAETMLGYSARELIGRQSLCLLHDPLEIEERARYLSEQLGEVVPIGFEALAAKARHDSMDEHNWSYLRKDGSRLPVRLSVSPIRDKDGALTGFLAVAKDITEQLRTEEKLENMAYFDQLTQLPNRALYRDRLEQTLFQAKRQGCSAAVLFLDLDKFKYVNDTLGHETGDKLLIRVADLLLSCVRESDTVSRLGGDEFTIILSNLNANSQRKDIGQICDKIIDVISRPLKIDGNEIHIGVSIGIAIFPEHGNSISKLNKAADVAMYSAKAAGRGCYYFYSPGLELNPKL